MKKLDYSHKPPTIGTARDLFDLLSPIPARFWCVDHQINPKGQHCVLGHINAAYGASVWENTREASTDTLMSVLCVTADKLAAVNNGTKNYSRDRREPGVSATGASAKARVMKFIKSKLNGETVPTP